MPPYSRSDHPGDASLCSGENWTANLINRIIMRMPDWHHTAIVLTWDEWGGFDDHVAPPHSDRGENFGLPLLSARERHANSLRGGFQFRHPLSRWQAPITPCPAVSAAELAATGEHVDPS